LKNSHIEYKERNYRNLIAGKDLKNFQINLDESDLFIRASRELRWLAKDLLLKYRKQIEKYINQYPFFKTSLKPCKQDNEVPEIIRSMIQSAKLCKVGPMAAVAGAIAEYIGKALLNHSSEVIIENGGDIFLKSNQLRKISIFAGKSPLSQKVILNVDSREFPMGICTSSGTVGPSLSFGNADAVTITSKSTSLADAAATAIGNLIKTKEDIEKGLNCAKKIEGIAGTVIIKEDKIGFWGDINFSIAK